MNSTRQMIRRVELPKFIGRASSVIVKYPTPIVAFILLLALIYTMYFIIIVKNFITMPLDTTQAYKNVIYATAALSSFFVIFSRNKFKDHSYMFFFLNSRVKPFELVLSGYAFIYISYVLIITLMFTPFLIIFWYQGEFHSTLDVIVLFLALTFVFCYSCTVWILTNLIVKQLFSKSEDQFYLTSFLYFAILGATLYILTYLIEKYVIYSVSSFLIILVLLFLALRWILIRSSTIYLNNIFIQLNSEGSRNKKQSLHFQHKNSYYLNMKLEWLHLYRNNVLKEQSLVFFILVLISFTLYFTLTDYDFVIFNSYLINFGLKEIFILFSLTIGISYRKYRNASYLLNHKESYYFIPRFFLVLLMNLLVHILYMGISYVFMKQSLANIITFSTLCSIFFITSFSMAVGFFIKINDSNKAVVIVLAIVFVNIYDFVIFNVLKAAVYIDLFNVLISIVFLLFIITNYIRKPFFK